jgi:thioredoxin reductase
MKDVVIIGGGPAGLTAALYLGRYQRKVILVSDVIGGQAALAWKVENYPGFLQISGVELLNKINEQVKQLSSVEMKIGDKVEKIEKVGERFKIKIGGAEVEAKAVLIAAGSTHRKLGIKGEDELVGKGISYCATCDGNFAKGKNVVVVGGGNAACESALILSELAQKVTLINNSDELHGDAINIDKLVKNPKITIINGAKVSGFKIGEMKLSGIEYRDKSGEKMTIPAEMVFIEIGQVPATHDFEGIVKLNEKKEIMVNPQTKETSTPGIFAAGDITNILYKQIIIAAGDGAQAAMAINQHLNQNEK